MFRHLEKEYIVYSSFVILYKYMLNGVSTKLKKQVQYIIH